METEPAKSQDSNAPENSDDEPLEAVPTRETTPAFAQDPDADEASAEYEPLTPDESLDHGDPDWSEPEPELASASNGEGDVKKTPEWAQTVHTDPGRPVSEELTEEVEQDERSVESEAEREAEQAPAAASEPVAEDEPSEPDIAATVPPAVEPAIAATVPPTAEPSIAATVPPASEESQPPIAAEAEEEIPVTTEPPRAVAADASKSTWPPAGEASPAPPAETDIWPPEPPTEHTMPAWPPPSELEEPATPAQAIPSWPDSFDAAAPAAAASAVSPAPTVKAPAPGSTPPAPAPSAPAPVAPKVETPPAPRMPVAPAAHSAPPAPAPPTIPPAAAPAHTEPPVSPSQPGPPSRPSWAPHAPEEPMVATPPKTIAPKGPVNVPAWAPRVPLASEPGTPTWFSPKEQVRHTAAQPASQPPPTQQHPEPAPPIVGGQLPVAPVPPTPQQAPAQPASQPTAKPTWEVVQKPHEEKGSQGPTPEDRSYAEWFAWAKRGGAPASACHAAAQGAFKALAAGKDVQTAVQWATAAMSRPPENVSYTRQTYCAWFSLANIDLNLDQHRAHAFAMAAVHALDNGQDAAAAHAAGLLAAGIR